MKQTSIWHLTAVRRFAWLWNDELTEEERKICMFAWAAPYFIVICAELLEWLYPRRASFFFFMFELSVLPGCFTILVFSFRSLRQENKLPHLVPDFLLKHFICYVFFVLAGVCALFTSFLAQIVGSISITSTVVICSYLLFYGNYNPDVLTFYYNVHNRAQLIRRDRNLCWFDAFFCALYPPALWSVNLLYLIYLNREGVRQQLKNLLKQKGKAAP